MRRFRGAVKRILVPVDFSDASLRAIEYAVRFARTRGARLILLHVIEPVYYGVADEMYGVGVGVDVGNIYAEIERAARTKLAQLAAKVRSRGTPVRWLVAFGAAYAQVVEQAGKLRADLIIMATHGRTGLSHVLIGSVADRVVRTAPVPVLTVPPRRAAAARAAATRSRRRRQGARAGS